MGIAADLGQLLAHVPAQWLGGPERSVVGEVWGLLAHYERAVVGLRSRLVSWVSPT